MPVLNHISEIENTELTNGSVFELFCRRDEFGFLLIEMFAEEGRGMDYRLMYKIKPEESDTHIRDLVERLLADYNLGTTWGWHTKNIWDVCEFAHDRNWKVRNYDRKATAR
jgi:hypothetical protein